MTRPSAGKAGTHGCFVVEVVLTAGGTRSFARRFLTQAEAEDFFTRAAAAHQQKANRENRSYLVAFYETATPKNTEISKEHRSTMVSPR